jgi:WbqC-like protein family
MLQEASALSTDLQYFPCINWFKDSITTGRFCFYPEEPFRRSGFRNRLLIPGSNGIISLSIPVMGGRATKLAYKQVLIDFTSCWQRDHFRTLDSVYGNSPFYFQYRDELSALYVKKVDFLYSWNLSCMEWVSSKIGLIIPIDYAQSNDADETIPVHVVDKYKPNNYNEPVNGPFLKYPQVFEDRIGFKNNMSILDMLFNVGPALTRQFLCP